MKIEIIGDGTVGTALGKVLGIIPSGYSEEEIHSDAVIICVPTPTINGKQDLTQIHQAISRIKKAEIVIIRSTVLPGTTLKLYDRYKLPFVFVPEFGFEITMEKDLKYPDTIIVGVVNVDAALLVNKVLHARNYKYMFSHQAELSKYIANIWGCTQVILANSIYDWVKDLGYGAYDYERAVAGAMAHPNIPKWGWRIYDKGFRGYGGKCLPKDIKAAISQYPSELWETIERINGKLNQ